MSGHSNTRAVWRLRKHDSSKDNSKRGSKEDSEKEGSNKGDICEVDSGKKDKSKQKRGVV